MNRRTGTTLIEVLVVIVIFLVGILAVVQIFPKGFKILLQSRNASVATSLSRDEAERLKALSENLPGMILPVIYRDGVAMVDSSRSSSDLGPEGASLDQNGNLLDVDGNVVGPWSLYSGANAIRRVVGETHQIPSTRMTGLAANTAGGLLVLDFGPTDPNAPLNVYANDLALQPVLPADLTLRTLEPGVFDTSYLTGDGEFFVSNPNLNSVALLLPMGATARTFHLSLSANIAVSSKTTKRDYVDISVAIPATTVGSVSGTYPLYGVTLANVLALVSGESLQTIELGTLRVGRQFNRIATTALFDSADAFQFKVLNPSLGVLQFNPAAHGLTLPSTGGVREALRARINYDVYDWRILRDDFRLVDENQHQLPIPSLKVASTTGADGLLNGNILPLESTPTLSGLLDTSLANEARADNFVLVDLDTGGVYMERLPGDPDTSPSPLIQVDKSLGLITFRDADGTASNGIQQKILLPDGTVRDVDIRGRAVRALYRAKNEVAVQVLMAASRYTLSLTRPGVGQYYIGGSNAGLGGTPTRIYFPAVDAGRKVSVGEANYVQTGNRLGQVIGQDFVVSYQPGVNPVGLPSIDLRDVDVNAQSFDFSSAVPASGIKGASVAVRVVWNPETFKLTGNASNNLQALNAYGRSYRRSTTETFIQRGEVSR